MFIIRLGLPRAFASAFAVLLLFLATAVIANAQTAPACTHYASPAGGGNGLSQSSPFKIQNFWSVAGPGKTLCLLDGLYQGADSMITPPAGLSGNGTGANIYNGICPNCITVRALNDGRALINGEFTRTPANISGASWMVLEGFNAKNGARNIIVSAGPGGNNIIRRIVAWDSNLTTDGGVFSAGDGPNLLEDVAAFGANGKIGLGRGGTVCRRCWVDWGGNTMTGDPDSAFSLTYGSRIDMMAENVLVTTSGETQPQTFEITEHNGVGTGVMASNFGSTNLYNIRIRGGTADPPVCHNSRVFGSIAYKKQTSIALGDPLAGVIRSFFGGGGGACVTWRHVLSFVHPAHPKFNSLRGAVMGNSSIAGATNLVAEHISSVRGSAGDVYGSQWTGGSRIGGTSLSALKSQGADPWIGTEGANLCRRWKNGAVTNESLWPLPMNERIKQATAMAGRYTGPCLKCTWAGGQTQAPLRTAVDVMSDIESLLGPIPSTCRSSVTTPPPPPPPSSLSGDLNADGQVNASDLQLEVNVILGTETNSAIRSRADLNGDGAVNALDLQRLVNIILGD